MPRSIRKCINQAMRPRPPSYFAASISMPEDLRDLGGHVRALRSSLRTEAAARSFAEPECATHVYKFSPLNLVPGGVDPANEQAVERYLRGIVSPPRFAMLGAMWEDLSLLDFAITASDVAALHETSPTIAQAALRLDIRGIWRLAAAEGASVQAVLETLVPQLLTIAALGHVFRYAQALAAQLHTPTGFPALDRIDYDTSAQAPKVGTVCKEFSHNFDLVDLLIAAYTPLGQLGDVDGYREGPGCDARTTRIFRKCGLLHRGKKKLKQFTRAHGSGLEDHLDRNMESLSHLRNGLALTIDELKAGFHYNTALGNIGRTSPAVLLYLVVEQAVSWLVAPLDEDQDENKKIRTKPKDEWPPDWMARLSARSDSGEVSTFAYDRPLNAGTRPMIDNLFAAYRFAVLGDNEATPAKFRTIKFRNPGAQQCHDHKRFISEREGPANFRRIMEQFRFDMESGRNIDTQAKREAAKIRDRESGLPSDAQWALCFVQKAFSSYI